VRTTTRTAGAASGQDLRTRARLIEAAGQVFAERGFRDATVREICRLASANVAAVSYHFGDKARLYSEVMRHLAGLSLAKYPPDMGVTADSSPQQKLHAFVRSFVLRILSDDRSAMFGQILARELVEPTQALSEFVQGVTVPMRDRLVAIVRGLLPPVAANDHDLVRRCATSVVGQIVFYKHCAPVIRLVFPGAERCDPESLEALASHITAFSLAGIRGVAGTSAPRAARGNAPRKAIGGRR
jgi:AcrR family transcriptional regulator